MLNVMSTAGASILAVGYVLPLIYLIWSLRYGRSRRHESVAGDRPGVANAVAAADRQLRRNADRHARALRLCAREAPSEYAPGVTRTWLKAIAGLLHHFDDPEQQLEASRIGMWVFLATEVMFFGGMFMGYIRLSNEAYSDAFAQCEQSPGCLAWRHQHGGVDLQQLEHGAWPCTAPKRGSATQGRFSCCSTIVLGSVFPRHQVHRVLSQVRGAPGSRARFRFLMRKPSASQRRFFSRSIS